MNYVGAIDRDGMLADRPKVEQALQAVCGRTGVQPRRVPSDHAGGKWRLSFNRVLGGTGTLEMDVNFVLRAALWPVERRDSRSIGSFQARGIPLIDVHELAAGKLAALLARTASRDVFDASRLRHVKGLDGAELRLAFVVYGGMNRKDWRTVSADDVTIDPEEADAMLLPLLRGSDRPGRSDLAKWTRTLMLDCREILSLVLPLTSHEREFLDALNDRGEINPGLLTEDARVQDVIRTHPGLLWKALNVRQHHGLDAADHAGPGDT